MEPILEPEPNRFVFKIIREDVGTYYRQHKASFWTPEEIDFQQDIADWKRLTANEQFYIKNVLAFFAASDGIVNENLVNNFYNEVQYADVRAFYSFQIAMENIHSETYALLLQTYITDEQEQDVLFHAIENMPAIKKKADWALSWTDPQKASFVERLIAFVAVEGIFFSGSFCSIFWLKKRGLLPGLTFSNELISRDEGLHCEFAINLFNNHIKYKIGQARIKEILLGALSIEKEFILESLPVNLIGMNSLLMSQYLEYVTDRLLLQLGCPKEFNVKNPFDFMNMISLEGKTNFFEKRVSEYSRANVFSSTRQTKTITTSSIKFDTNDF